MILNSDIKNEYNSIDMETLNSFGIHNVFILNTENELIGMKKIIISK